DVLGTNRCEARIDEGDQDAYRDLLGPLHNQGGKRRDGNRLPGLEGLRLRSRNLDAGGVAELLDLHGVGVASGDGRMEELQLRDVEPVAVMADERGGAVLNLLGLHDHDGDLGYFRMGGGRNRGVLAVDEFEPPIRHYGD